MAQIKKRNGVWYSDFRDGERRIRKPLSPYKEKALALLDDMLKLKDSEKNGTHPNDVSWFFFREKYLTHCRENKASGTYYLDKHALDMVERYGRGLTRLSQMTPGYLTDFMSKWRAKKLPEKTGIAHMRRVKTAMHWARAWDYAPLQDWKLVKTPANSKRIAHMDYEGFLKVLATCSKGRWTTAAMLMGYAGLRSAEVRYLEWRDVDFKNRLIHIRAKTIIHPDGTKELWRLKGVKRGEKDDSKDRVVDLPKVLENYLQSLTDRTGFVLGGDDLTKKHTFRLYFRRATHKVKFKVYAHMFRHSYASFLISSGSTLPEVGSLLGHSDARSTQVYTHMLPHARRHAVDRMESGLNGQSLGAP